MKTPLQSKSQCALELAGQLLDDIELNHLAPEKLLLKAMRLARIPEHESMMRQIGCELCGSFPLLRQNVSARR